MHHRLFWSLKTIVVLFLAISVVSIGIILAWVHILSPFAGSDIIQSGWLVFAFVSGLTMIVLPCSLPMALVVVSYSRGSSRWIGMSTALAFGLGVSTILVIYGIFAALAGSAALSLANMQTGDIKNWIYFIGGCFGYIIALSEIGVLKFTKRPFAVAISQYIQKTDIHKKAFFLGLFLGNIVIGFPYPAAPLLFLESASSGDVIYGGLLFFTHALGRIIPIIFLSLLAILGARHLDWFFVRKEKIASMNGWAMLLFSAFILTLGLFGYTWSATLSTQGIFYQYLVWGSWLLPFLLLVPVWWFYLNERQRVFGTPVRQIQKLERIIEKAEEERSGLEVVLHIPNGEQSRRVVAIDHAMERLIKERTLLEESIRYGAKGSLRDAIAQSYEEEILRMRFHLFLTLSILLIFSFFVVV